MFEKTLTGSSPAAGNDQRSPNLYQNVFNVSKWKFSADYESVGGQTLSGGTSSKNSPNPKWPP